MTARTTDGNGWQEIEGNPISKVGVFPYLGAMIDPNGEKGLDPEGVYQVYRSAEELSDPDTIESFKLIPWIDDHAMLGQGFDETDETPIAGVIGEKVYFDSTESPGYLRANIKVFSGEHAERVDDGKKELSCGYRCEYEMKEGTFGDQKYSVAQTKIRGNHLASIDEGRMGPEVAVLDERLTFAIDTKDFSDMAKETVRTLESFATDGVKPEEVATVLQLLASKVCAMDKDDEKAEDEDDDEKDDNTAKDGDDEKAEDMGTHADDGDDDEKGEDADDDEKGEDMDDDKEKSGMDALESQVRKLGRKVAQVGRTGMRDVMKEIGRRDALYAKVSSTIGVFDHADMTSEDVAVYACDKLGLKVTSGHEMTALDAYFTNRPPPTLFAVDSILQTGAPKTDEGAVADHFKTKAS